MKSTFWRHDTWAEDQTYTKDQCQGRKSYWDRYCGTTNSMVIFVEATAAVDGSHLRVAANVTETLSTEHGNLTMTDDSISIDSESQPQQEENLTTNASEERLAERVDADSVDEEMLPIIDQEGHEASEAEGSARPMTWRERLLGGSSGAEGTAERKSWRATILG